MARKVSIPEASMAWLHANHRKTSYRDMAAYLRCCEDTLKRVLVREGLLNLDGAKYLPSRPPVSQWTRPCIVCRKAELRPRGWYRCRRCRERHGFEEF